MGTPLSKSLSSDLSKLLYMKKIANVAKRSRKITHHVVIVY